MKEEILKIVPKLITTKEKIENLEVFYTLSVTRQYLNREKSENLITEILNSIDKIIDKIEEIYKNL